MAEYVRQDPPEHRFDTLGLLGGLALTAVGLIYLAGGDDAISRHSWVLLPTVLVLVGVAGLAGSRGLWLSLVRRDGKPVMTPPAETFGFSGGYDDPAVGDRVPDREATEATTREANGPANGPATGPAEPDRPRDADPGTSAE